MIDHEMALHQRLAQPRLTEDGPRNRKDEIRGVKDGIGLAAGQEMSPGQPRPRPHPTRVECRGRHRVAAGHPGILPVGAASAIGDSVPRSLASGVPGGRSGAMRDTI